jgi:threonine dehydrogenase-like Zn-dependent dehydrogenase
MRAAFIPSASTVEIRDVDDLVVGPGEVRIEVDACGICGSNLHAWRHPELNITKDEAPGAAGHEVAGVIVGGARDGERVVIEPNRVGACRECEACRNGTAWFCRNRGAVQAWGFSEEMVVPDDAAFGIPEGVDPATATLVEPMACGVHALRWSHTAGSQGLEGLTIAVLGSGVAGLLTQVVARHLGAGTVVATARHPQQRDAATSLGADLVVDSDDIAGVKKTRPDVVVEAVGGGAPTFGQAFGAVKAMGEVVLLGLFDGDQTIDARRSVFRELRVFFPVTYGVRDGVHDYSVALEVLDDRAGELGELITHRFPLGDTAAGFETAADKSLGPLRVVVEP